MHKRKFWGFGLVASALLGGQSVHAEKVWQECNGRVLIEAEDTESPLGTWKKVTKPANFTGTGGLEFTGNNVGGGNPNSPLKYPFEIKTSGNYLMQLRSFKNLMGSGVLVGADKSNDTWVTVTGPLGVSTTTMTSEHLSKQATMKYYVYGKTATEWDFAGTFENMITKIHGPSIYNLQPGKYTIELAGRAQYHNIDRIAFFPLTDSLASTNPALAQTLTCGATQEPTCTDGFKNGAETGVDCGGTCPNTCSVGPIGTAITYLAVKDFTLVPATASTATYTVETRGSVQINASNVAYRNKWAAATVTHKGTAGTYDIKLTGMQETDGETSYKISVNGTQIGSTVQNARIFPDATKDYALQVHTFTNVSIKAGDILKVESDVHSNSLAPEGGKVVVPPVWAWARGRWTQIELVPVTTSIRFLSRANNSGIEVLSQPHNPAIQFNLAGNNSGMLSIYSASGSLVKSISVSGQTISWDKKTKAGHIVNPGVYSAVFLSQGQLFSRSFVVF